MKKDDAVKQVYLESPDDGTRPYAMLRVLETNPTWTDREYNDFVETFWEHSNHTSTHWEAWADILDNYYPKARKSRKPTKPITVYRGGTTANGFSWTTDFDIARKFAMRNSMSYFSPDGGKSTIWQATVDPIGVMFMTNGRHEQEVVVRFWEDCWESQPFDYVELYQLIQQEKDKRLETA